MNLILIFTGYGYDIYPLDFSARTYHPVFQISSTQTLDHPPPPPLLFMFNSGRLISIAVILCRIYFYSSKLSPLYWQWIIPTDRSIVLSGILTTSSGIWFVFGIRFTAQHMGIRHPLSYNIRIENVRNFHFRYFLRFKNVSEVNLYETETNSLPILWQYSNFKRCFLCVWKQIQRRKSLCMQSLSGM